MRACSSHIFAAIALSFAIGGGLALLAHYAPVFRLAVHGRLSPFLNSFSGIGWTLLSIVWFGVNDGTVVFAISVVLIPFAIINIREGEVPVDTEMLEMAASFTRSRWRQFTRVVLPALVPFIFATIRISYGVAWKVALAAELFGGRSGLGYLFNTARQNFDMPLILVVVIVIIALALCAPTGWCSRRCERSYHAIIRGARRGPGRAARSSGHHRRAGSSWRPCSAGGWCRSACRISSCRRRGR